jgi:hypothetical protein
MNGNRSIIDTGRPDPHFWLKRTTFLMAMWSIVVSAQQAIYEMKLSQLPPSESRH